METTIIEASEDKNIFIKIINGFLKFFKNIFNKDDILTPAQQLAFDIFKICLYDNNNIRYLDAGLSYKKYIVTKQYILDGDISTFIVLETCKITIVNHQYRYSMTFPEKTSTIINRMFNDKVIEDRKIMEEEILSNINQSLEIVLSQFKEKLQAKEFFGEE